MLLEYFIDFFHGELVEFNNIGLDPDNKLDQQIDGITGATMSVVAMKKITQLALVLHDEVSK